MRSKNWREFGKDMREFGKNESEFGIGGNKLLPVGVKIAENLLLMRSKWGI